MLILCAAVIWSRGDKMTEAKVVSHLVSQWHTQVLRLTAFPGPDFAAGETSWWADLVGQRPERQVSQPREAHFLTEGPFQGGKLSLSVEFNRVDWLLAAAEEPASNTEGFPTIGPFPDTLEGFLHLMLRWLGSEDCPELARVAFGSVLLQPVGSRDESYRRLGSYLPSLQLDAQGSSDFLYRINRPRASTAGLAGLRINRLSTWSAVVLRSAKFAIGTGPGPTVWSSAREEHACRLELDVNTMSDFKGLLPRQHVVGVFQELVNLGKEIAERGDIP